MNNSLKERIISTLAVCGSVFSFLCIMHKIFDSSEGWLLRSIMWATSWSIGYFISKTMAKVITIRGILFKLLISFVLILVISFITGVLIISPSWDYIFLNTFAPFALSFLDYTIWKMD